MRSRLLRRFLWLLAAVGALVLAVPAALMLPDCTTNRIMLLNNGRSTARVTLGIESQEVGVPSRTIWTGDLDFWSPIRESVNIPTGGFTLIVEFPESGQSYRKEPFGYTTQFDGAVHFFLIEEDGIRYATLWSHPPGEWSELSFWEKSWEISKFAWIPGSQVMSCIDLDVIEGRRF